MIKLVVSDIDGTLLPEGTDQINPKLYDAIRKLKKKGILFAGASGRQYASMHYVFRPVADDMIFIAENGSNVMCRGQNMLADFLDETAAREVVQYLRTLKDCAVTLSTPEVMYVERATPKLMESLKNGYHNEMGSTKDLLSLCSRTNKISVYRREGVEAIAEEIIKRFGDRLNVTVSGSVWIDFMNPASDKGNALKILQEKLNISVEETMAFGDNCNDIGMLSRAGESYAVANAHPQLKEAARYVTLSNTEDGVLKTIRERLL